MEGRKRIRTSPELYTGRGCYFLTVCTHGRAPVFANPPFARAICRHFLAAAAIDNFSLHAWCVMPDHVHLLAEGRAAECRVRDFMQRWKGGSSLSFRKRYGRESLAARVLRSHPAPKRITALIRVVHLAKSSPKGPLPRPARLPMVRLPNHRLESQESATGRMDSAMEETDPSRGGCFSPPAVRPCFKYRASKKRKSQRQKRRN